MDRNLRSGPVKLKPLEPADADILADLANDKSIWDNLRDYFPHPYTIEHAIEFIGEASKSVPPMVLSICHQEKFAGIIGLNPQDDVYRKSLEIGYWLGRPFWNMGIATRAVGLMTTYAFDNFDCHRLHTGVYSYNIASMKVLEKCGFQKEGISRQAVWKNQQFWDEHRYALLKDSGGRRSV